MQAQGSHWKCDAPPDDSIVYAPAQNQFTVSHSTSGGDASYLGKGTSGAKLSLLALTHRFFGHPAKRRERLKGNTLCKPFEPTIHIGPTCATSRTDDRYHGVEVDTG